MFEIEKHTIKEAYIQILRDSLYMQYFESYPTLLYFLPRTFLLTLICTQRFVFFFKDSLPCIDQQGLSHNNGEAWEPDNCQQCNCVNGKLSCNHTICSANPHESCVEIPASVDQCCPVYQCSKMILFLSN